MNKIQLLLFITVTSSMLLAPPKGIPDFKANEARKRLQQKLLDKANPKTDEGLKTIERVNLAREENMRSSQEFVANMLNIASKKSSIPLGKVPRGAAESLKDPRTLSHANDLLGGKPINGRRELKQVVKLAEMSISDR